MAGKSPIAGAAGPERDSDDKMMSAFLDMLKRGANTRLDDIEEPTAADLAAMDELEDLPEIEAPLAEAAASPSPLALLAQVEEPELLSLERLDDAEENGDELDEVEELLDDVETLIEDYVDIDLDDDELDDEGYDLDDDDISSYHDLYGDDDAIIPSFREGEFAEEEDGDTDYYNELR